MEVVGIYKQGYSQVRIVLLRPSDARLHQFPTYPLATVLRQHGHGVQIILDRTRLIGHNIHILFTESGQLTECDVPHLMILLTWIRDKRTHHNSVHFCHQGMTITIQRVLPCRQWRQFVCDPGVKFGLLLKYLKPNAFAHATRKECSFFLTGEADSESVVFQTEMNPLWRF